MPQKVDIFVPVQQQPGSAMRSASHQNTAQAALAPAPQVRIVPNDALAATKKQILGHLRPRYVVQRTPLLSGPSLRPESQSLPEHRPLAANTTGKPAARISLDQGQESALKPPLLLQPAAAQKKPGQNEPSRPVKKKERLWRRVLLIALAAPGMLAAGLMTQSVSAGEVLIGAYAAVALLRRIESRVTYMLALASLACILVLLLARPDPVLMQNFAVYAFLFILIGTLSLTLETRY